jgi:TolB protein
MRNSTLPRPALVPLAAAVVAILAGSLAGARPAAAAFLGGNGSIAYECGSAANDICVMSEDGSGQTQLTSGGLNLQPAWSPDGSRIAFERLIGGHLQVFVMDDGGSNQTRLTNDATDDRDPAWSPDGTKIAFTRQTFDGTFFHEDVWTMNADGSGQTQLTFDGNSGTPAWSPDGEKIAFSGGGVYLMNPDGSDLTQLNVSGAAPNWSPDGQRIVFDCSPAICVMNADGSGQTVLFTGNVGSAAWSPDGTKIAFTLVGVWAGDVVSAEIEVMNPDGSDVTDLTNSPASNDLNPDWQPLTATPGPFSNLRLRMAGPRRIGPGDPITYVVRVRNEGPGRAERVVVSDMIPAGTSFVRAFTSHGSCSTPDPASATLSCSLGSMGDGSHATIIVVCRATGADTTIANAADVSSRTPDPSLTDNSATIVTRVR